MTIPAFKHGKAFASIDSPDALQSGHWRRGNRRVHDLNAKMTWSIVNAINLDSFGIIIRKIVDSGERLTTSANEDGSSRCDDSVHDGKLERDVRRAWAALYSRPIVSHQSMIFLYR